MSGFQAFGNPAYPGLQFGNPRYLPHPACGSWLTSAPYQGSMPAQFGGLGLARGPMGSMAGGRPHDGLLGACMDGWQRQQMAAQHVMPRLRGTAGGYGLNRKEVDMLYGMMRMYGGM